MNQVATPQNRITLSTLAIALLGVVAFVQVSMFPVLITYAAILLLIVVSLAAAHASYSLDKRLLVFLFFFISPVLISVFSLPIAFALESDTFDYSRLNVIGRIANIILLFTAILFIHKYVKKRKSFLIFKWYWFGIIILLASAAWHAFSIYTPFIDFPFETRSHLHSANNVELTLGNRVTGFAREPSYFIPFVVDFIALTFLFVRNYTLKIVFIGLSSILLLLALSPSGYILIVGAFLGAYVFSRLKFIASIKPSTCMYSFLFCIAISAIFFEVSNSDFFKYFYLRVSNLELESSDRLYMNVMPFIWSSESSISSFLFGHGIKSYSIIGTEYFLPRGGPIHVTSNNLFVDIFWEAGIIGLSVLLAFFLFVFLKIMNSNFERGQVFLSLFVLFDLFLSSFFRADFASLRFFIMVYILYLLIYYDYKTFKRG